MQIINGHIFDLAISFHEDIDYSEFYLYDSGQIDSFFWQTILSQLADIGLSALNGVDDPNDPILGHTFENGYFSYSGLEPNPNSGEFSDYLLLREKTKRYLLPEIPTSSTDFQKSEAIKILFTQLLQFTF